MERFERVKLTMEQILEKIENNDPYIEKYVPSIFKSPVWSQYKCIFYNGARQNFAQCNSCGKVMMHKARTGNSQLLRHKCHAQYHAHRQQKRKKKFDTSRRMSPSESSINPADAVQACYKSETDEVDRAAVASTSSFEDSSLAIKAEKDDGYETILHSPSSFVLSREELLFKIAQSDPNVSFTHNSQHPKFVEVLYCKERQQYCRCIACGDLVERGHPETSVAHFYRHKCQRFESSETFSPSLLLQAKLVYKSLRSPELFDDLNFAAFCASLVDARTRPDLANRTRMSHSVLPTLVEGPKAEIAEALEASSFALTSELWKRENEKILTLFGSCISDAFVLKHYCLGVAIMASGDEDYDATVDRILEEYCDDVDAAKQRCVFVTDGRVKLRTIENVPCVLGTIDDIVRDVFSATSGSLPSLSGLKHLLEFVSTDSKPADSSLLQIFKEMAFSLAKDHTETTIDTVLLWKIKLLKHFAPSDGDSAAVVASKKHISGVLERKFGIHDFHKIGVILNPKFKHLKFVDRRERASFEELLFARINENLKEIGVDSQTFEIKAFSEKTSKSEELFAEFMESSVFTLADSLKNEIRQYIDSKLSGNGDLLPYWANSNFEDLKRLVRKSLMIPACSMQNRIWMLGLDEEYVEKRKNLSLDDIQNAIFLFHNMP